MTNGMLSVSANFGVSVVDVIDAKTCPPLGEREVCPTYADSEGRSSNNSAKSRRRATPWPNGSLGIRRKSRDGF